MKLILTLLLITLFLDASYIRSIRVTSFLDKSRAEKGLIKLKQFIKNHKNLHAFEEKFHFQYTLHKIDKHYMLVIEPLKDKKAVQEILDTLREKYTKAYPRKLETLPSTPAVIEPKILIEPTEVETIEIKKIQKVEEKITPKIVHDNFSNKKENSDINRSNEDISSLLISVLATLLIISFFYVYLSRRKKRKHAHSKTLTEIVIDNNDELKPKNTTVKQMLPLDKEVQSLVNNNFNIEYKELNTQRGLDSYEHIVDDYKNALKTFQKKHANSAILIEKLCHNLDFTQALSMIQVIKEESNQIGALNLHESIKIMQKEIELKENAQWEKSIWSYGITMRQLFIEIDHYCLFTESTSSIF